MDSAPVTAGMREPQVLIKESSGNIFRDLGFPHPEREHLKARLTLQIYRLIKDRGLTQTQAGQILGIRQPHGFSHLKSPSSRPAGSMARCLWFSDNLAAADYGPAQW
jgi:predicted XRE-type DNA-binding protein